jgi:hypothetical protein
LVVAVGSAAAAVLGPTVLVEEGVCICERIHHVWCARDVGRVDTRGVFDEVAWVKVTLVVVMVPYMYEAELKTAGGHTTGVWSCRRRP